MKNIHNVWAQIWIGLVIATGGFGLFLLSHSHQDDGSGVSQVAYLIGGGLFIMITTCWHSAMRACCMVALISVATLTHLELLSGEYTPLELHAFLLMIAAASCLHIGERSFSHIIPEADHLFFFFGSWLSSLCIGFVAWLAYADWWLVFAAPGIVLLTLMFLSFRLDAKLVKKMEIEEKERLEQKPPARHNSPTDELRSGS